MPHNIEKSAFRKGEYVGYAHGVWRIRRSYRIGGTMWKATKGDAFLYCRTLKELSVALDKVQLITIPVSLC